jgi:hypothetical protein
LAAAAGLGTILLILRAVFNGVPDFLGISAGPGWSGYVRFIAGIALTAFTFVSYRESGETLPKANHGGTTPPPAA